MSLINLNALVGKTVKEVQWDKDPEPDMHSMGYPVILFTDNSALFVSRDEEQNGPGSVFFIEDVRTLKADTCLMISTKQEKENAQRKS